MGFRREKIDYYESINQIKKGDIMSRKLLLLGAAFLIIFASSCDKVLDKLGQIDGLKIEQGLKISYLPVGDTVVTEGTSLRKAIEGNLKLGETIDQIEKVTIDSLYVEFIGADDQENFDFLDHAGMAIQADSLNQVDIASINSVPEGATSLVLNTNELYIDDYAKADSLTLHWNFKSTEAVNNLKINTTIIFSVKLKVVD